MDEFIHRPKPYLLLSSTYDEILSWMKKHLVSDSKCNTTNLQSPKKNDKKWQIMVGWHLVLVTLYQGLQLELSKTIRIGDSKYHI